MEHLNITSLLVNVREPRGIDLTLTVGNWVNLHLLYLHPSSLLTYFHFICVDFIQEISSLR